MTIKVNWYDDAESILHWQFIGDWRWEDYFRLLPKYREIGSTKPHMLAVILDFTRNESLGRNSLALFRKGESLSSSNVEVVIIVGNAWVRAMVNLYIRFTPDARFPLQAVSSLSEAAMLIDMLRNRNIIADSNA